MNPTKTKEMYQRDLNMSRMNLLLSVVFTVVNLVMVFFSLDTSFFFSASIPHTLPLFFAVNCGMFDASYYKSVLAAEYGEEWETLYPNWESAFDFVDPSLFWAVFAVSVVIIIGLILLWYFSKKHRVCSMLTLTFYIADTVFLMVFSNFVGAGGIELILQLLFHLWIVYYAWLSVRAWKGMATAPSASEVAAGSSYGGAPYGRNPYVGSPYGRPYGGYDDEDDEDDEEDDEDGDGGDDGEEEAEESDTEFPNRTKNPVTNRPTIPRKSEIDS